jgi:dienelactone hydrolase
LLSNFSEEQDRTSDFATEDEATQALYQLDDAEVMDDLQAVASYAEQLDASN